MRVRDRSTALRFRAGTIDPAHVAITVGLAAAIPVAAAAATVRPGTTLLALAVLVIVGVTLVRTDVAVMLLVATGPLESAFATSGSLSVTKVAGALAFASFGLYIARNRKPLVLEHLQWVVLAILGLALASATQAHDLTVATTTASRYASFVALYIVISQLEPTPALQRRIAWVLAITSAISAILGLGRYFEGKDSLANLAYSNPNDFAFILATSLPLIFWLLGGKRLYAPLVVAMIGIVFAAILLSLSRGTLVGLFAGFLFLIVTDRRRLQITLLGGVTAIVAAGLVINSNPQRFQNALTLKQHVAQENVTTRYEAWSIAGRLAADHPLLGIGPGNFRDYYTQLSGQPAGTPGLTVAHDAYLDIAAEIGLPAALLFLLYLSLSFNRLTIATRRGDGLPGFAQALRISLVIALVCSVFLSEQYYLPFWLIGALGTALWAGGERRAAEEAAAEPAAVPAPA
jgi:putative inorganic carbon (HCO3(-)) transporter